MITVLFTCHVCGLEKKKVSVRNRHPNEDIVTFIEEIASTVGDAHSMLSPTCKGKKADIYLPADDVKGVGY